MNPQDCQKWVYYDNPAPAWATARAVQLLQEAQAGAHKLGDSVFETGADGRLVRYDFRQHPPDAQNPLPHLGVEVKYCADVGAPGMPTSADQWTVEGVDVSDAQGGAIDWGAVAKSGRAFAFIKATEGDGEGHYKSPQTTFAGNWARCDAAGLLKCSYHYFRAELDGVAQAKHHALVVKSMAAALQLDDGDFGPAVDVEDSELGKVSPAECGAKVLAWCQEAATQFARRPIVYTSPDVWTQLVDAASAAQIADVADLWIAHWGVLAPGSAAGWAAPMFWQYSSDGQVDGIQAQVDLDRWHGTLDDLTRYAQHGPPTRPSPPAPTPNPSPSPAPGGAGASGLFRPVASARARARGGPALKKYTTPTLRELRADDPRVVLSVERMLSEVLAWTRAR
jgi:GH25 family lysozyme M1 (1,4-beta-N-acetylmuramidase)